MRSKQNKNQHNEEEGLAGIKKGGVGSLTNIEQMRGGGKKGGQFIRGK